MLRQSFTIYIYIRSFLNAKRISIVHYSSKINKVVGDIWLTYYNYILPILSKQTKTKINKFVNQYLCTNLSYTKRSCFQLCFNKTNLSNEKTYYYLKKNKQVFKFKLENKTRIKKLDKKKPTRWCKNIITNQINFKYKRVVTKKVYAILKDQLLSISLMRYLKQFFDLNFEIRTKNIKRFLKNSARRLNKTVFKSLRFYKKFNFFKDTLYIANITTYCNTPTLLADHLVTQLCRLRNQWPLINVVTNIIKEILHIRLTIKGFKLLISGRLQGRNRKKTYTKVFGSLPLQTFSNNINYALSQDYNIFGMFGVRVCSALFIKQVAY